MASNNDLIKSIAALNPDVETEGLNNAQLFATLKSLKLVDTPAALPSDINDGPADDGREPEAAEEVTAIYHVKMGKALTSKRGILSDGDEIKAEYLPGGQEAIDAFVISGHVVVK